LPSAPADKTERFSYENRLLREKLTGLCNNLERYYPPTPTISVNLHGVFLEVDYTYVPPTKESPVDPPFAAFASITAVYCNGADIMPLLQKNDIDFLVEEVLRRLNA
jgi:hypothetical protein